MERSDEKQNAMHPAPYTVQKCKSAGVQTGATRAPSQRSIECRLWSVQSAAECKVQNAGCNAECRVQSAECRVQSAECVTAVESAVGAPLRGPPWLGRAAKKILRFEALFLSGN